MFVGEFKYWKRCLRFKWFSEFHSGKSVWFYLYTHTEIYINIFLYMYIPPHLFLTYPLLNHNISVDWKQGIMSNMQYKKQGKVWRDRGVHRIINWKNPSVSPAPPPCSPLNHVLKCSVHKPSNPSRSGDSPSVPGGWHTEPAPLLGCVGPLLIIQICLWAWN